MYELHFTRSLFDFGVYFLGRLSWAESSFVICQTMDGPGTFGVPELIFRILFIVMSNKFGLYTFLGCEFFRSFNG